MLLCADCHQSMHRLWVHQIWEYRLSFHHADRRVFIPGRSSRTDWEPLDQMRYPVECRLTWVSNGHTFSVPVLESYGELMDDLSRILAHRLVEELEEQR